MKRIPVVLLVVASMILSSLSPLFAQDPDNADASQKLYLPLMSSSNGTVATDDEPAVTQLQVPRGPVVMAGTGDRSHELSQMLGNLRITKPVVNIEAAQAKLAQIQAVHAARNQKVDVIVRLTAPSVAESLAGNQVSASSVEAQQSVAAAAATQQADIIGAAQALDAAATPLARVNKALNAVALRIAPSALPALAANPNVLSIQPVLKYHVDLSETVPYIGATAVQQMGFDGTGIRVAVLDSGIDYTHVAFGGAGTAEAYEMAYGTVTSDTRNTTTDGLFPTAKVIGGYDFVGESWDGDLVTDLSPDPDPIGCGAAGIPNDPVGCDGDHGTHVGDIIAGARGVAPGASLYAVKVCSAISSACSNIALLQGMDFALDPNGDSDLSDHVDVINMSLGSDYGQEYDDDLSFAVENASAVGVLTVASAGNGADKPYVAGTPGNARSALSVAQTQVPSAVEPIIEVLSPASVAGRYEAGFQPWSATPDGVIQGSVQYGVGEEKRGCSPLPADSATGKILMLDKGIGGDCPASIKVSNAVATGALAVILAMDFEGDPYIFAYGGGDPAVPAFSMKLDDSDQVKAAIADGAEVTVKIDPAQSLPLVGQMVGSSSRGPSMSFNTIKPEIGAPGASVSAVAGTGTGAEPFSGTSGAAPMVSGSAALLMQAKPGLTPAEYKAILVNNGETNIWNKPAQFGGYLAPITRIGGGEVRVNRAVDSSVAAWEAETKLPTLSFGFSDITESQVTYTKTVYVRNYSERDIIYRVQYFFRYMNDEALGGVSFNVPQFVTVPAKGDASFPVELTVHGDALRNWSLTIDPTSPATATVNSGPDGANPEPLTLMEMDGYIKLSEPGKSSNVLNLPWQMLPRRAADTTLKLNEGAVELTNRGVGTAYVESYSLIGKSDNLPEGTQGGNAPQPDLRYVGVNTYPVPSGYCSANPSFVMAFAVNTWERETHADAPLEVDIELDVDQDGKADFVIFNADLALDFSDGHNVVWVANLATNKLVAPYFYTSHETNSSNLVLYICGEQIDMNASNFFQPMNVNVYAFDNFSTGDVTDAIEGMTISPLGERYRGMFRVYANDFNTSTNSWIPSGQVVEMKVQDFGPITNNTETGLLLLYRNGAPEGQEAAIVEIAGE
ncbi:MAG: S8 family serine peptidase [Caldilineaceae bacterium]